MESGFIIGGEGNELAEVGDTVGKGGEGSGGDV